ncbi:MAG TPA: hypothetical protein VK689_11095, partial [Armatimonadota bacterium]|nr:hypothetical protein [Armatimonadota bacterium]
VVEAVAVGNSHGAVIEFSELGVPGMYFTMAGQDAFEGAYLTRYAMRAPRLKYVLFAASYGVQRKDHAVVTRADVRSRRRGLYARTPLQRPIAGDWSLWIGGMLAPVVREDHWKCVIERPIRKREPIVLREDGGPTNSRVRPPLSRDSLLRYGTAVAAQHQRLGDETFALAPDVPVRVAATLDSLARDLRARGVVLVLYTPPYHESYLRAQDPAVNAEAHAVMGRIAADNSNVVWLDYSTDPRFRERDDLFSNSDHLNRTGGRAFSRLLGQCLRPSLAGSRPTPQTPGCPVAPAQPQASATGAPVPR